MARFLSPDWVALLDQPEAPSSGGPSLSVQILVTGAPDGEVRYHWALRRGQLCSATPGQAEEPDITLTQPYAEASRIHQGVSDLNAAFMSGVMKVAGDPAAVLSLLRLSATPDFRAHLERVHQLTDYQAAP